MSDHSRLVELESSVAHLQHDFDQLGSVVIEQRRLIDELRAEQEKLQKRIEELLENPEQRDPEAERPPHY